MQTSIGPWNLSVVLVNTSENNCQILLYQYKQFYLRSLIVEQGVLLFRFKHNSVLIFHLVVVIAIVIIESTVDVIEIIKMLQLKTDHSLQCHA